MLYFSSGSCCFVLILCAWSCWCRPPEFEACYQEFSQCAHNPHQARPLQQSDAAHITGAVWYAMNMARTSPCWQLHPLWFWSLRQHLSAYSKQSSFCVTAPCAQFRPVCCATQVFDAPHVLTATTSAVQNLSVVLCPCRVRDQYLAHPTVARHAGATDARGLYVAWHRRKP